MYRKDGMAIHKTIPPCPWGLTVLLLVAYLRLRGAPPPQRRRACFAFAAASGLLITANDVVWIAVTAALVAHWTLFGHRDLSPRRAIAALAFPASVAAGWFLLVATADKYGRVEPTGVLDNVLAYAVEMNAHVLPIAVLAIGAGLSVNNTAAVLSAFGRRTGTFRRTPKRAIIERTLTPGRVEYHSRRGLLPWIEITLAAWASTTACFALSIGLPATGAFHALFAAGLAWVGAGSLREDLRATRVPSPRSCSAGA